MSNKLLPFSLLTVANVPYAEKRMMKEKSWREFGKSLSQNKLPNMEVSGLRCEQ